MKKISKNFLSLFISDVANRIIGFFATVYIARLLAAEGFGQISYGLAFLSYALLFANPGLTIIGAREVAKDNKNRRIIDEILGFRLTLAIIIFFIFLIGFFIIPGQSVTKQIIILYALSLFPFAILLEFVFQAREEMEYIGISRFSQYIIYIILLFVLLKSSKDILIVPISFFFGYCAASAFLLLVFLNKYKSIRFGFSIGSWHNLLIISIPVGLATIFNQAYLGLPPIILGIFHSKAEVGLFSAGFKIIVMLLIIDRVFYYLFFPILTKQYKNAPEKLKGTFTFVVRILFAITIPLTCGGILLADSLVNFIYGIEYAGAISIFRILLLYFLIVPINTIFGYGLISINQERKFFKVITITTVLNLILIVILGINFKGPGAAVALFMGEIVSIILMNRELKKLVKFETLRTLPKPILASIVMAAFLYVFHEWHIIFLIILGIFIYTIVLYLIKGFSNKELKNLVITFVQK